MESSVVDTQLVKNVLTVRDSPHVSGIQLIEHFSFCGFKFMQFYIIPTLVHLTVPYCKMNKSYVGKGENG